MRNKKLLMIVSTLALAGLLVFNAYARVDQILWNTVVKGDLTALETVDFTDATVSFADETVDSAAIDEGVIQTTSVDLTATEVKALYATPQELVAAPGAGKAIEFVSAVLILDYGTADYVTNGNLSIETGTTGTTLSDTVAEADFLFNSVDSVRVVQALSADEQLDDNESLVLSCATGDPATGDSPVTVKVVYRVYATGL